MKAFTIAAALLLAAAGPPPPPDWPCVQRYVPTLAAASLWPGPPATDRWRTDPALLDLAAHAADRQTPPDDAAAAVQAFAAVHPDAQSRSDLFAALVDRANAGRNDAVDRLHGMDRRLRALADASGRLATELNALPQDAPPAQHDDLAERRKLVIREYDSINRMLRYACEVPVGYESRLGRFAQILAPGAP